MTEHQRFVTNQTTELCNHPRFYLGQTSDRGIIIETRQGKVMLESLEVDRLVCELIQAGYPASLRNIKILRAGRYHLPDKFRKNLEELISEIEDSE